jgi:hypothetical protein
VDTFGTTVLGRCIGGGDEVVDTVGKAPGGHRIRDKFAVIGHKDFKGPVKLGCDVFMPVLQNDRGLCLVSQWK